MSDSNNNQKTIQKDYSNLAKVLFTVLYLSAWIAILHFVVFLVVITSYFTGFPGIITISQYTHLLPKVIISSCLPLMIIIIFGVMLAIPYVQFRIARPHLVLANLLGWSGLLITVLFYIPTLNLLSKPRDYYKQQNIVARDKSNSKKRVPAPWESSLVKTDFIDGDFTATAKFISKQQKHKNSYQKESRALLTSNDQILKSNSAGVDFSGTAMLRWSSNGPVYIEYIDSNPALELTSAPDQRIELSYKMQFLSAARSIKFNSLVVEQQPNAELVVFVNGKVKASYQLQKLPHEIEVPLHAHDFNNNSMHLKIALSEGTNKIYLDDFKVNY